MLFAPLELDVYEKWLRKSEKNWRIRQEGKFSKVGLSPEIAKRLQEVFPYHSFMVNYQQ